MTVSAIIAILLRASVAQGDPPPALYLIENVTSPNGVVETRSLVRLSMDRGNNLVKDTLVSKDQRFFGHFGGHCFALDHFVVTRFGAVIDIQSKKVIHNELDGELLGLDDGKAIYRINHVNRTSGLFSFDLRDRKLGKARPGTHWDLPGAKSPDKTMSAVQDIGGVVRLHEIGKAPKELARQFGFTYSKLASPSGTGAQCAWLDNGRILTVKANNTLAILTTQGKLDTTIEIKGAPVGVLTPPRLWLDNKGNVIYSCGGEYFSIDVRNKADSPLKRFAIGHGFEASVDVDKKQRRVVYHDGNEIGQWVFSPFQAQTAPGLIAFAFVEPGENANLGQAEGVAVWDARFRDWRGSKMWVNDLIGWQ